MHIKPPDNDQHPSQQIQQQHHHATNQHHTVQKLGLIQKTLRIIRDVPKTNRN
jgi:hypothetical protein